jgi:hypothetical protein
MKTKKLHGQPLFSNHFLRGIVKMQKYQPLRQFFRKIETENFVGFRAKFSAE